MTSGSLRERLDALPALQRLLRGGVTAVGGVPQSAAGLLAWWLRGRRDGPVLIVSTEAERLWADAAAWEGPAGIELWPAADVPAYDRVPPSEEVTRRRIATLAALAAGGPLLVVASPQALLRPTLPVQSSREGATRLRRGDRVDRDALMRRLVGLGYRRVVTVSAPGDFAARGGIVDVFGLDRSRPWRAEWFGDELDELRAFDVDTQVSVARLEEVVVWPARELDLGPENVARTQAVIDSLDTARLRDDVRESWDRDRDQLAGGSYEEGVDRFFPYLCGDPCTTLLDHLGDAPMLLAGGREPLLRAASRHLDEIESLRRHEEERGELPGGSLSGLLPLETLEDALRDGVELLRELPPGVDGPDLGWRGVESHAGRFEAFIAAARAQMDAGRSVLVLSRQQHRVEELTEEAGIASTDLDVADPGTAELPPGSMTVGGGDVSGGADLGDAGVLLVSDAELFGIVKRRGSVLARGARRAESTSARGRRRAAGERVAVEAFTLQFEPGDLVVHRDHGVGRFLEMRRVAGDEGGEHEYMILEYAEGDRLFVPVEHLDRVDRYVGGSDAHPPLSRLGTGEWERTRRRVKQRTEEVARELLGLYSRREMALGHAYGIDSTWQRELEASFPWEETPDQLMVLEEIKRDMETSKPMDRVVCGDVGFGKTELALRAAFKAASEGRQVAMLVPTTVLCQQHFLTFSERLRPFPITVRQLSRFCTEDEVRDTLLGLKTGGVDIVIGTHRLLQRDVEFRNLGLVVIDEEQRFGVLQKERFKELRLAVDVLSLSATPIPRTLHMSLAGLRDLSVIQTPPEERQPIKTYVTAREDGLVREVITRELARGGQVFFVHNRVQGIERVADWLRDLVPEARTAVAHGQMQESLLAEVMRRFSEGEIDVLLCTTIVESGLDIPNANTIVIDDAHRLGLAQLYQLRGRVGRAGQRAYAYLLYPPERALTERADKRLDVISDLQELGAGFKLAMRDLEIRGAGNLLGEEQHGEIAAVGLEMYNHMLRQAVTSLQGKPLLESPMQVTVSLPVPAFLPVAYIEDERLRLRCYQDLAACAAESELEQRARGLADRFGPLPREAEALVYSLRVRLLAAGAGVTSVESEKERIVVQLPLEHGLDLEAVARQWRSWITTSPTRLILVPPRGHAPDGEWQDVLLRVLRELGRLARARQQVPV